jgi:hypothetical protein
VLVSSAWITSAAAPPAGITNGTVASAQPVPFASTTKSSHTSLRAVGVVPVLL